MGYLGGTRYWWKCIRPCQSWKGVIEVALGGYGCDGGFQLFDVDTVEIIMTHELGHGIGLMHSTDRENIMYPSINETKYAYCLLDVSNLK